MSSAASNQQAVPLTDLEAVPAWVTRLDRVLLLDNLVGCRYSDNYGWVTEGQVSDRAGREARGHLCAHRRPARSRSSARAGTR